MNLSAKNKDLVMAGAGTHPLQSMPNGFRPWEDPALSAEQRFDAYKAKVREEVESLIATVNQLGPIEAKEFEQASSTRGLLAHAEELATMTIEDYSAQVIKPREIRGVLGKGFLGAEEWKAAFGVDVGAAPLLPASITKELLESPCPFEPSKQIKDTHLLVLMPQTVNGQPFSALKLDELCSDLDLTGYKLIRDDSKRYTDWKQTSWASEPLNTSEWVLMLTIGPSSGLLRDRGARQQLKALESDYPAYQPTHALDRMTLALLYEVAHQEKPMRFSSGRCQEPSAAGNGRVIVCRDEGLEVRVDDTGNPYTWVGMAVSRKL